MIDNAADTQRQRPVTSNPVMPSEASLPDGVIALIAEITARQRRMKDDPNRARIATQQGRDLLILKKIARRAFKRLITDYLPFSYSTATDYMKLARLDIARASAKVGRRTAQPSGSVRKALARIEYHPKPPSEKALERFHTIVGGTSGQRPSKSWYELHHGDCLELMKGIPENSADMILADLPYGATNQRWDEPLDLPRFWEQVRRIIRPCCPILMFADLPFAVDLINSNRDWYKYDLTWITAHSTGFVHSKVRPLRRHHTILVFSDGTAISPARSGRSIHYFPKTELIATSDKRVRNFARRAKTAGYNYDAAHGLHVQHDTGYPDTVLDFPIDHLGFHPTEKPIALLRYLIELYTRPGDLVLNPTMGAGSAGVACGLAGRRFVGIEKEREFLTVPHSFWPIVCEECLPRQIKSSGPYGCLRLLAWMPVKSGRVRAAAGLACKSKRYGPAFSGPA